jgi:hypothetical protein
MNINLKIIAEMKTFKKETTACQEVMDACLGKDRNQGKPKVRLALKEAYSRTGGCEVSSEIFHQAVKNEKLDTVQDSVATQIKEETTSRLRASAVGAPATP